MKPKAYVDKYNLEKVKNSAPPEFWEELFQDFLSEVKSLRAESDKGKYSTAVKKIKDKWIGICRKAGMHPDKGWGYFFATKIAPHRDEVFAVK